MEGPLYYIKTGALAFNVALPLALLLPVLALLQRLGEPRHDAPEPRGSRGVTHSEESADGGEASSVVAQRQDAPVVKRRGASLSQHSDSGGDASHIDPVSKKGISKGGMFASPKDDSSIAAASSTQHEGSSSEAGRSSSSSDSGSPPQPMQQQVPQHRPSTWAGRSSSGDSGSAPQPLQQQQVPLQRPSTRAREWQRMGVVAAVAPLWLWLAAITCLPHKEERFLYVVYPLVRRRHKHPCIG